MAQDSETMRATRLLLPQYRLTIYFLRFLKRYLGESPASGLFGLRVGAFKTGLWSPLPALPFEFLARFLSLIGDRINFDNFCRFLLLSWLGNGGRGEFDWCIPGFRFGGIGGASDGWDRAGIRSDFLRGS